MTSKNKPVNDKQRSGEFASRVEIEKLGLHFKKMKMINIHLKYEQQLLKLQTNWIQLCAGMKFQEKTNGESICFKRKQHPLTEESRHRTSEMKSVSS